MTEVPGMHRESTKEGGDWRERMVDQRFSSSIKVISDTQQDEQAE